jgi:predicted nucleic acid-binding protein
LNQQQAFNDLKRLRNVWTPILPVWTVQDRAESLMTKANLSLWDAMIIAACAESGVSTLYSEDFDSSTTSLTGVTIVNPFV